MDYFLHRFGIHVMSYSCCLTSSISMSLKLIVEYSLMIIYRHKGTVYTIAAMHFLRWRSSGDSAGIGLFILWKKPFKITTPNFFDIDHFIGILYLYQLLA
ncbi:elongator complex protein 1-like isoform X1 [Gossypium australe]|uniref:Elongator complex protein 1-like isoform X1 n=1 Tax=Gossypium australe TaxID=47621 RepID=A0A5B6WJD8_9ROSI|nr:elongator complex protein 1-like isoform X1 [Gossypium australe]